MKREKTRITFVWEKIKKWRYHFFILYMALSMTSCGNKTSQDSGQAEGTVAIADFYYMPLNTLDLNASSNTGYYAIDGEWLYYATYVTVAKEEVYSQERYTCISRCRISDNYLEEEYVAKSKDMSFLLLQALFVDGSGNSYVFWGPGYKAEEEDRIFSLEKYDSSGELVWKANYNPDELQGIGDTLKQGTATADGRVFLYSYGQEGKVFVFDPDGNLTEIYTPELDVLNGVATGKDGKVYGYCITEETAVFTELGDSGEKYPCPEGILEVYDGRGSDPCVRMGKGVWSYTPETGELERLWEWEDEYIQISENDVDAFFRNGESFMVMCSEYRGEDAKRDSMDRRPVQTFASITLEDGRKYPARQRITLGTVKSQADRENNTKLDLLVRMYNRQSRDYRVEFIEERDADSMQMKFIQGEGADIIDLRKLYAGNLAGIGAFEDLTAYYEASDRVNLEDILDPVREACVLAGKNVLVMPSFKIQTLLSLEEEVTVEDWDVWEFLEKAESEWVILLQDPLQALDYCLGIRKGEAYIDYENRRCDFNNPEFRSLLKTCKKVLTNQTNMVSNTIHPDFVPVWIESPWDVAKQTLVRIELEDYSDRIVGYPGMNGAEHKFYPDSVFAMNSASKNKEGAWDFLEFLMSEEVQSLTSWGFPSREDAFEKSLSDIYISPVRAESTPRYDKNGQLLANAYAKEVTAHDIEVLRGIVENAKYDSWGGSSSPLQYIFSEEAGMYFNGDATLDTTINKIQNRVQLYLDEQ